MNANTCDRSGGEAFVRSPGWVRGINTPPIHFTTFSSALAIMPFIGWGQSFSASVDSTASITGSIPFGAWSVAFAAADLTFTYLTLTGTATWDTGQYETWTQSFSPFWANGFGVSTQLTLVHSVSAVDPNGGWYILDSSYPPGTVDWSSWADPSDPVNAGFPAIFNGKSASCTRRFPPYPYAPHPYADYHDCTYTLTLSNPIFYKDVAAASLVALGNISQPPLIGSPTYNLQSRTDIIWPDSGFSFVTQASTGYEFAVCAANGVYSAGTSAPLYDGLGSLSLSQSGAGCASLPGVPVILSAKSKWFLTPSSITLGSGLNWPPFQRFFRGLDGLYVPLNAVTPFRTQLPSNVNVYNFPASDVPALGQIGFYNAGQPFISADSGAGGAGGAGGGGGGI